MLDEIIKGGTVVDGTGAPGVVADVGIARRPDRRRSATIDEDADARDRRHRPRRRARASSTRTPTTTPSCSGTRPRARRTCTASPPSSAATAGSRSRPLQRRRRRLPPPDDGQGRGHAARRARAGRRLGWETFGEYLDRLEGDIAVNAGLPRRPLRDPPLRDGRRRGRQRGRRPSRSPRWRRARHARIEAGGARLLDHAARRRTPTATASRSPAAGRRPTSCSRCARRPASTRAPRSRASSTAASTSSPTTRSSCSAAMSARRPTARSTGTCSPSTRASPTACRASSRPATAAAELGGRLVALTMPVQRADEHELPQLLRALHAPGLAATILGAAGARAHRAACATPRPALWMLERSQSQEAGVFRRLADWGDYVLGDTYSAANEGLQGPHRRATSPPSAASRPFDTLLDIVIADDLRTVLWPIPPDDDDASWRLRARGVGRPARDDRRLRRRRPPRPHVRRALHHAVPRRLPPRPQLVPLERAVQLITERAGGAVRAARPRRARARAPSPTSWCSTPRPIGAERRHARARPARRLRPPHRRLARRRARARQRRRDRRRRQGHRRHARASCCAPAATPRPSPLAERRRRSRRAPMAIARADLLEHLERRRAARSRSTAPTRATRSRRDQRNRMPRAARGGERRPQRARRRAHRDGQALLHRRRPAGRSPRMPSNGPRARPSGRVGDVARNIKRGAQRLIAAMLDCEKPVIAAVNGTAAGIGAHIALRLRPHPRRRHRQVHRGVRAPRASSPDGGGAYLLPRIVGLAEGEGAHVLRRRPLGRRRRAHRARQQGRPRRRARPRKPTSGPSAWPTGPTKAIGLTKWLLNRSLDSDRNGALRGRGAGRRSSSAAPTTPPRVSRRSSSAATSSSRAGGRRHGGRAGGWGSS